MNHKHCSHCFHFASADERWECCQCGATMTADEHAAWARVRRVADAFLLPHTGESFQEAVDACQCGAYKEAREVDRLVLLLEEKRIRGTVVLSERDAADIQAELEGAINLLRLSCECPALAQHAPGGIHGADREPRPPKVPATRDFA